MVSLHNFSHVCSNLVNCSKVRLGATSMAMTKYHLKFSLALQRQGLISTIDIGGKTPPGLPPPPKPEEITKLADNIAQEPWKAYPDVETRSQPDRTERRIPSNPAKQRIWLGLKYYQNKPVISKIEMISKPSRRVTLELPQLEKIIRGRDVVKDKRHQQSSHFVKGFSHPGECMFVLTPRGLLEARDAVQKKLGGMVLCRLW